MGYSELWWRFLIVAMLSYVFGSVNSAITISKLKHRDIRHEGSGNPGTMNMSRVFGMKIALLVFVMDVLKGVIPTLVARLVFLKVNYYGSELPIALTAQYLAGLSAVLGHVYPVFYRFKGGKGIATTIGVFAVGEWYITLIFCAVALAFIFITRIGSMGSFIATTPSAIAACIRLYVGYFERNLTGGELFYFILTSFFILVIIFLTWFAHRKNIERLLAGEEHDTNWWHMLMDAMKKK